MSTFEEYLAYDPGKVTAMCDHAQQALIDSEHEIYQTETDLVHIRRLKEVTTTDGVTRPKGALVVDAIPKLMLHEWLECAKFKTRKINHANKKMGWEKFRAPEKVSAHILARKHAWTFPLLTGVVQAPTLLANGEILSEDGYDPNSGLYLDTNGVEFPEVPDEPTEDEVREAIARLKEPFFEFPFTDVEEFEDTPKSPGLSVVLAAILTGVTRQNYPTAPAFAMDASAPGSGKTTLWDSVATIVTG